MLFRPGSAGRTRRLIRATRLMRSIDVGGLDRPGQDALLEKVAISAITRASRSRTAPALCLLYLAAAVTSPNGARLRPLGAAVEPLRSERRTRL